MAFGQKVVFFQDGAPHLDCPAFLAGGRGFVVLMAVGVFVRMVMVMAVSVLMLMLMLMVVI
ncbi:MAG: hypothetical protein ABSG59_09410 [Verrucomicrobiota bacterium]